MDNISFVSPESALKSEFTFNFSDLIQGLDIYGNVCYHI